MEIITTRHNETNALENQQSCSPSTQEQIQQIRCRYPTFKDFCDKFSNGNTMLGAQHPTQCLTCSSPTLTYINLTYGEGNAIAWLIYHLTFFQENVNVPNKMSKYQIETCAQTIYDTYHHLKATELMLFFARLSGGMYPVEWHGYVSPTKIISAIRDYYMPWRNNLLYKIERNELEKREKEYESKPRVTWDEYKKMMHDSGKEIVHEENPLNH